MSEEEAADSPPSSPFHGFSSREIAARRRKRVMIPMVRRRALKPDDRRISGRRAPEIRDLAFRVLYASFGIIALQPEIQPSIWHISAGGYPVGLWGNERM